MSAPGGVRSKRWSRGSRPACGLLAALLCLGVVLHLATIARACGHTYSHDEQAEVVQRYLDSRPLLQQSVGKVR
jgi:hypothetical protein